MQRYISADYIFPVSAPPLKGGLIELDQQGKILDIIDPALKSRQQIADADVEKHQGIICPGFINAHCHLELSHLKDLVPEKTGMAGFIKKILSLRGSFSPGQISAAIEKAEKEMIANGIVAVGDISNNDSSFAQKQKGNLLYYTLIEVLDLDPSKAQSVFGEALQLFNYLTFKLRLNTSIVPHSPYTVSDPLFESIRKQSLTYNLPVCIHLQESQAENELFVKRSGQLYDLFTSMGINLGYLPPAGQNSMKSTLNKLPKTNRVMLVHNTYSEKADVEWAMKQFKVQGSRSLAQELFFCFCPNANLYIENKLPDFNLFVQAKAQCCVGTDSLASNHSLSILEELKLISAASPDIPLQTLLTWSCLNGASFLGFEKNLGSIEKGKKPGLNLITGIDTENLASDPKNLAADPANLRLNQGCSVKKLR